MKREWKPGDVAMVEVGCHANRFVGLFTHSGWRYGPDKWVADDPAIVTARPLVVIDLGTDPLTDDLPKRTEGQLFVDMLRETAENFFTPDAAHLAERIAIQIDEQIESRTPPKPDEPTGLGAVVEDAGGHLWFRMTIENQTYPGEVWQGQYDEADRWSKWDQLAAVRVLSEGVTP